MKWQFTINQRAIIEHRLTIDLVEAAIFDLIKDFSHSEKCRKTIEGGKMYYWFSWKLITEQAPILGLKTRQSVYNRIERLIENKLLERHPENRTTGQSWFCFGDNYIKMVSYVPVNESLQAEKEPPFVPVNESLQGVNESLQGDNESLQTCKDSLSPPVNESLQHQEYINYNLNNTPTTPAHVHEGDGGGGEENNLLPDWAKREREEMITDINAANKEIPPKVPAKAPPYFWDEVFPELYQQVFFERVFFQTKTRFVGKTPEYVSDFIKEQIVGFQYVFADEYPDGVESFKRAKDFFINWLSAGLRKGVFDSPNQKSNHGNSNQSSKATFEDVLRVVNENYYGKPQ